MTVSLYKLQSPLIQFLVFLAFWSVNFAFKWRDTAYILQSGINLFILWILASGIAGVRSNIPWSYYLYLLIALTGGYVIFLFCFWISEKWGGEPFKPYNSEGALAVLVPVGLLPLILLPLLVIKFICSW
jgi:hypothetical protein